MLHYTDNGEGHPLVFLHGFCEDSRIWQDFIPHFLPSYRVICPDLPGAGKSPLSESNLESWADELWALLDQIGAKKPLLIGHSLGGYTALAMAEKRKELSGLILFHSSSFADNNERIQSRVRNIRFIREHGVTPFVQQLIPSLFAPEHKPKDYRFALKIATEQKKEGLISALEAMKVRPERSHILARAGFPVMVLSGLMDSILSVDDQARIASWPAQCQFSVLRNSGHMGFLEEPEEAAKQLTAFFENMAFRD